MNREEPSASVSLSEVTGDKQVEEDLWQRHKTERGVWTKSRCLWPSQEG